MRAPLLLAFLLLAGCTAAERETSVAPLAEGDAADAPPLRPRTIDATILPDLFDPGRTTIAPGTTVVWRNVDNRTHSVVSDDGAFAGSGPLGPASLFAHTFERPGEYAFHCRFHPTMTGSILVR